MESVLLWHSYCLPNTTPTFWHLWLSASSIRLHLPWNAWSLLNMLEEARLAGETTAWANFQLSLPPHPAVCPFARKSRAGTLARRDAAHFCRSETSSVWKCRNSPVKSRSFAFGTDPDLTEGKFSYSNGKRAENATHMSKNSCAWEFLFLVNNYYLQ